MLLPKNYPRLLCNKDFLVKWLSNGHCEEFFNHNGEYYSENRIHSSKLYFEACFISLYNHLRFPLLNKKAINFWETCLENSKLNVNASPFPLNGIKIKIQLKSTCSIKYFWLLYFLWCQRHKNWDEKCLYDRKVTICHL